MSAREAGVGLIEVELEDPAWAEALPGVEGLVVEAAMAALTVCAPPPFMGEVDPSNARGRRGQACDPPFAPSVASLRSRHLPHEWGRSKEIGPVTVLLTDDATVRDLNARFRAKDYATNVLSFPAAPQPGPPGPQPLGDLALAFGVCAAEAKTQGKSLADHLRHLVAHGVLHLLGHDHEDDAEAEVMEALEREILAGLGVADPYLSAALSDCGAGHV